MRCPKCGYHSFDSLEACKKCSHDLIEFKAKYGLCYSLAPGQAGTAAGAASLEAAGLDFPTPLAEEPQPADDGSDFGFDFMGEQGDQAAAPAVEAPAAGTGDEEEPLFELPPMAGQDENAFSLEAEEEETSFDLDADWGETAAPPAGDDQAADEEKDAFSFDQPWEESPPEPGDATAPVGAMKDPAPIGELDETFSFSTAADELSPLEDEATDDVLDDGTLPVEDAGADLSDWNPFAEPAEAQPAPKHPGSGEEPSAPFELRGSEPEERAPEAPAAAAEPLEEESGFDEVFLPSLEEEPETDEPVFAAGPETFDFAPPLTPVVEPAPRRPGQAKGLPEPLQAQFAIEPEPAEAAETDLVQWSEEGDESRLEPTEPAVTAAPASLALRLVAGAIDLLALAAIFVLFLMAGEMALFRGPGRGLFPPPETLLELAVPYFLVLFAVCFCYFTLFHFMVGQTLGKMLLRLRLEGADGSALSFSQAFLHSSAGLLCVLSAGAGFAVARLNPQRQGWNDRIAATRVVRTGRRQPTGEDRLEEAFQE